MVGGRGWGGECGCAGGACVRDDYSNYRLFDDEAVVQPMNQLFSVHYSNTIVLHCAVLMAFLLCLQIPMILLQTRMDKGCDLPSYCASSSEIFLAVELINGE